MSTGCKICDDKVACRAIDDELERGMTYSSISRLMTLRGFSVGPATVSSHSGHRAPSAHPDAVKQKRDFAIMVRDKAADLLEEGRLDLVNKDRVPGINAGLKAQATIDRREQNKQRGAASEVLTALLAALRGEAPVLQIEDGMTIEGEAVEVD